MRGFLVALGFLTAIPVKAPALEPGDLGRSAAWFPLVGLGLGALLSGAQHLLSPLFSPLVVGALVVAVWAALTGALHLEGLGDSFDGLFSAVPRERRLEIMHDPHLGAFGTIGSILFLVTKVHSVASLPLLSVRVGSESDALFASPVIVVAPLVASVVFARWVVLVVARQRPARSDGFGAEFAAALEPPIFLAAAAVPIAVVVLGGWRTLVALLLAHLLAFGVALFAKKRLAGITGDILGFTVEVVEIGVLLAFAAGIQGD